MITRHVSYGWEIIYQYAHGLLAGEIAQQIAHGYRPEPWVHTLAAVINHDDYMLDFSEKSYLDERGAPLDFLLEDPSDNDRLAHAKRVIDSAYHKSGRVALLVSHHYEFLYREASEKNPDMRTFLDEQVKWRGELRRRYGLKKADAEAAYRLLRFCDRTSLILCRQEVPARGRLLEINRAMDNQQYFIRTHPREEQAVTVEPWCFEKDSFTVSIDVQCVRQLQFKDNDDLARALAEAEVEVRTWTFRR